MTLQATDVRVEYTATLGQTTFAYPWRIFAATDLAVYVEEVLQPTALYTVTGVQEPTGGGHVIFGAAVATGAHVVLVAAIPADQQTDLTLGGVALLTAIEAALDRLTRLHHQALEALTRSMHWEVYEGGPPPAILPSPVPLRVPGLNADASAWTWVETGLLSITPDPVSRLTWVQSVVAVPAVSGQTTLTAAAFLPAGLVNMGVVAYVVDGFGNSLGLTTIAVGMPGQVDRWAGAVARTMGSASVLGAAPIPGAWYCPSAQDVTVTANAGTFDGDGSLILTAVGYTLTPAQSV